MIRSFLSPRSSLDSPGLEGGVVLGDLVGDVGKVAGEEVLDPLDALHALVTLLGVHLYTDGNNAGGQRTSD